MVTTGGRVTSLAGSFSRLANSQFQAVFQRHRLRDLDVERCVDVGHHALAHQLAEQLIDLDAQRRREGANRNRFFHLDRLALFLGALGLHMRAAAGDGLDVAVEGFARLGRMLDALFALDEVGVGELAEFFVGLAAPAVGAAAAR